MQIASVSALYFAKSKKLFVRRQKTKQCQMWLIALSLKEPQRPSAVVWSKIYKRWNKTLQVVQGPSISRWHNFPDLYSAWSKRNWMSFQKLGLQETHQDELPNDSSTCMWNACIVLRVIANVCWYLPWYTMNLHLKMKTYTHLIAMTVGLANAVKMYSAGSHHCLQWLGVQYC